MQDSYAGDVSDYAKCVLLNRVIGQTDIRLGVLWYYVDADEVDTAEKPEKQLAYLQNADTFRPSWPDVFDRLNSNRPAKLVQVQALVAASFARNRPVFFDSKLSIARAKNRFEKIAARLTWFEQARKSLTKAELVFMDPDNGLEVPSIGECGPRSLKHATYAEAFSLFAADKSLVIIQFKTRGDHEEGRRKRLREKARYFFCHLGIKPFIFDFQDGRKLSFIVVANRKHSALIGGCTSNVACSILSQMPISFD